MIAAAAAAVAVAAAVAAAAAVATATAEMAINCVKHNNNNYCHTAGCSVKCYVLCWLLLDVSKWTEQY